MMDFQKDCDHVWLHRATSSVCVECSVTTFVFATRRADARAEERLARDVHTTGFVVGVGFIFAAVGFLAGLMLSTYLRTCGIW